VLACRRLTPSYTHWLLSAAQRPVKRDKLTFPVGNDRLRLIASPQPGLWGKLAALG